MANALPGELVIDAARDIILAARDGDPNGQVQAGATSLVFDQAGGSVWQSHGGSVWTALGAGSGGAFLPLTGGTLSGALTLNAALSFASGAVQLADTGSYLQWNSAAARSFYITADFPSTFIYSPSIYLGATSGTVVHFRGNALDANAWAISSAGYLTHAGAQSAGMIRAKGWATGAETGLGAELGVTAGAGYLHIYDRTAGTYGALILAATTITLLGSGGTAGVTVYGNGHVGIQGGSDVGYALHVGGSVLADSWLRVGGTAGLYFESYGGGWYMTDSSFIRAYNNKHIYAAGASYYMDDGGGLRSTSGVLLLGAAPYWGMYSSNTTTAGMALRFSDGTLLGMLYGDTAAFGLLNNAAGWAVRILNGTAGGSLYGSWTVTNNLSVTGQVSGNTGFFTGSVNVGGLSVGGYTVLRGRTGSATSVPTDLAPGEIYFGTP